MDTSDVEVDGHFLCAARGKLDKFQGLKIFKVHHF